MSELEDQIDQWRDFVRGHRTIAAEDVAEMEDHLRGQVDDLVTSGLTEDEAFLVAVKRMGGLDELSREFAREHSDRLWKQLVLASPAGEGSTVASGLWTALAFAVANAAAVRIALFWLSEAALARTFALVVIAFIAGFFAWQRHVSARSLIGIAVPFVLVAVTLNAFPWHTPSNAFESSTEILAALHAPILLWLAVGLAYVGADWRSEQNRMNFIRFTGEWLVYLALLALGGGVLLGLTGASLASVGIDPEPVITGWLLPCGAAGATVVAAWLVEAKQDVIENMAPVLTKVFTPLTIALVVALLWVVASRHSLVRIERDLLTVVDLILVLVLGLVLYAISARPPSAEPGLFDRLQFVLLAAALAADAVLLVTMLARILDAGFTANKVAALGMNLVLLINLIGSTRLLARFNRGASPFAALERWQTSYLPVYGAWAALVVVALPPLFAFA